MSAEIEKQLAEHKASKTAIEDKRNALLSILYDPDNGIATLRGKSRENVRMNMIKIVYMFFKVPEFFFKGFINFMITGPAGSGKTKIGGVVSHMMKNLGILATKNVTMATKQNMTAEFMGQSGPKTRKLLAKSIEGVLFIDEAYTLTPCPGVGNSGNSSFSEEAVGELINFIDKFVGCMVVIVAGYKQKMYDCFLAFNEGMARRFPRTIDLLNYTGDDLYEMFHSFLADSVDVDKVLDKKQLGYIKGIIVALNENGIFTNQAGDMLNLSKTVGEDAVLYSGEYNTQMIKLSFKKFCSSKGVAIDF
jgi:SpoVK/Ycf46/Vps4 family AAA+-type ATPase